MPKQHTHWSVCHGNTTSYVRRRMSGLTDLGVQDDPFEYYDARRAEGPVWHEDDLDLYVIGGLPEARAALTDRPRSPTAPGPTAGADEAAVAYHGVLGRTGWARAATLQRTDPPVHTRYRKLLNRVFTAARVRELTPRIDEIVHELIDGFVDARRVRVRRRLRAADARLA